MTSSVTVKPVRGVRGIGTLTIIVGIVMMIAGGVTYGMVTSQLRAEHITVSDDAQFLAGHTVQDPFTAYAQAEVINKHALEMTDGKTYAQLAQDDPQRATVMNASFLRASLFTSVVAFGVAAFVVVCGLFFILFGAAFRRLGRGDVTVLEVVPAGESPAAVQPAAPAGPVAPAQAAPLAPAPASPAPVAPAPAAPVAPMAASPVRSSVHTTPAAAARASAPEEVPASAFPASDGASSPRPGGEPDAPASAPQVQANAVRDPSGDSTAPHGRTDAPNAATDAPNAETDATDATNGETERPAGA